MKMIFVFHTGFQVIPKKVKYILINHANHMLGKGAPVQIVRNIINNIIDDDKLRYFVRRCPLHFFQSHGP